MNHDCIQNLRDRLQRRMRLLDSSETFVFHDRLRHFWKFLHQEPILHGIIEDLKRRYETVNPDDEETDNFNIWGKDETEHVGIALARIRECVHHIDANIEANVGLGLNQGGKLDGGLTVFQQTFLHPLYDYLEEHLDDQRALLALLRRYKHRCEWFRRGALLALWQSDPGKGERKLTYDLYEYLHDQGLDFAIEPSSASGKPDLISAQVGNEKLIADAKVYRDDTPKAYLASGFHQIYQYTLDYNQPFGYLVIFKTCENDLKFPMSEQEQSIPFLVHNNKTIFFVVVDICQHEATASKRGILRTVEVTEADLIQTATVSTATGAV